MIAPCLIMNSSNDITKRTNRSAVDLEESMTLYLEERLKQSRCNLPCSINAGSSDLPRRLARAALAAAPSSSTTNNGGAALDFNDKQTFERTMRNLQNAIIKRRNAATGSQQQKQQQKSSRRQRLIEVVGTNKAQQIISLIREIRVLRLRRKDLLVGTNQQPVMCGRGGCSSNVYALKTSSSKGRLPKEVRDLFFNTALVDVVEKGNLKTFDKLPWDQLYAQGRLHVQAYRAWLQAQEVTTKLSAAAISRR